MCLAVPGEILDIRGTQAKVAILGAEAMVNIHFIEDPKVGDYVLVHAGCAIEKIEKIYFNDLLNIFQSMKVGEEMQDEPKFNLPFGKGNQSNGG